MAPKHSPTDMNSRFTKFTCDSNDNVSTAATCKLSTYKHEHNNTMCNRPLAVGVVMTCRMHERSPWWCNKMYCGDWEKAFFTLLCTNAGIYSDMACMFWLNICVCCKYANFVEIATCNRAQWCEKCFLSIAKYCKKFVAYSLHWSIIKS